ncbi:hypothetical protein ORJ00_01955 [Rheinheimera baltica]|uniref:hypothetical protein n=1 Tax=Rheinheimera baltica TaxID=67576 RepID=UPI00273FFE5E|nr:hypothetical protein [Rheinheimera baltica]MDP5141503.1 hypothetical protein [Rheinheimera baltica]
MAKGIINLQSGNPLAAQTWLSSEDSFAVPFVWHDGHIIIKVAVNDANSLRFAFDSAAAATVLFETSRTQTVKLDVERQLDLQGRRVNVVNNGVIRVGELELSELTFIHVPIGQNPLFSDYDTAYFDGAIGYDLLNRFNITILFAEQSIVFSPKGTGGEFINEQWVKLPLLVQGRIPYVDATMKNINGGATKYAFVVDTGAPDYIYLNEQLAEGFAFPAESFETQTQNFDGKQVLKTSRIDFLGFANESFQVVAAHDLPYFKDAVGVGMIGSGLLRKFGVHFNYQAGYLALTKNRLFSNNTYIDRSGLTVEPHRLGALVKEVAANSHATELGITTTAILTTINGEDLTEENFDNLRWMLSSDAPYVTVCWQANGPEKCGDLMLIERISAITE